MKKLLGAVMLLLAVAATGCGGGGAFFPNNFGTITNLPAPVASDARFNIPPQSPSDIPFPDDIIRTGPGNTNVLPGTSPTVEPAASFNTLQGFSTSGTIAIPLDGTVQASTVTPSTVLVFNSSGAAVNVTVGLTSDGSGNSIITVTPTVPLASGQEFLVVVTPGVLTTSNNAPLVSSPNLAFTKQTTPLEINGVSTVAGLSNTQATALEPIREQLQSVWASAATDTHLSINSIPIAFQFLTESEFSTLVALQASAISSPPLLNTPQPAAVLSGTPFPSPQTVPNPITQTSAGVTIPQFLTGLGLGSAPNGAIAEIVFGSFQAPNFQNQPTGSTNPTGFFVQPTAGGLPTPQSVTPVTVTLGGATGTTPGTTNGGTTNEIDFIVCLPFQHGSTTVPQISGVPCVIFQHGFTRTNVDVFAIANSICASGQGVIAINLQLHGDRGISGQTSGTGFVNFSSLRATRDNLRQSASDLAQLTALITSGHTAILPNNPNAVFSQTNPEYIGQSLGGIMGGVFLAINPSITTGVLNVPGGRLTSLVVNSPELNPELLTPLGLTPGSTAFNQFLYITQTLVDDGDPFNYAPHLGLVPPVPLSQLTARPTSAPTRDLATGSLQVLMQEMIGDTVVPNSALDDLALAANVNQVSGSTPSVQITSPANTLDPLSLADSVIPNASALVGSGLFQFTGSDHFFLLAPDTTTDPDGIVTAEGQEQAITYLATGQLGTPEIIVPSVPVRGISAPAIHLQYTH